MKRKWQHLNFFEHTCYLHRTVPQIKISTGKDVPVFRARANSDFTLLFEATALDMTEQEMQVIRVLE